MVLLDISIWSLALPRHAAEMFNLCRAKGASAVPIDMLIGAVAHRFEIPVYSEDRDLLRYAAICGISLRSSG